MGNRGAVIVRVVISSFSVIVLANAAFAAGPPKGAPGTPVKVVSAPPDDKSRALQALAPKLEVVSLTVQPPQPFHGDVVTLTLTVRNAGTGAAKNITWGMFEYNASQRIASGVEAELGPGGAFSKSATWKAVAGARVLRAGIGPLTKIEQGAVSTLMSVALDVQRRPVSVRTISPAANGVKPAISAAAVTVAPRGSNPADAKIDPKDLKINVKEVGGDKKGNATLNTTGVRGLANPHDKQQTDLKGDHRDVGRKDIFVGEDVIKGAKYGDTFGGRRINDKNGVQVDGNFKGSGKGLAGGYVSETQFKGNKGFLGKQLIFPLNYYGGRTYYAEVYMGPDEWNAQCWLWFNDKGGLQQMTWVSRENGVDRGTVFFWTYLGDFIGKQPSTPNPSNEEKSALIIFDPTKSVGNIVKSVQKQKGAAGSPDDGRNPNSDSGAGGSEHAETSVIIGKGGGQDAEVHRPDDGGKVNMDEVLKINEVTNPTNVR